MLLFGSLAALSANPEGLLAGIKILNLSIFDAFDALVSNILLPLNGLLIILLCGYSIKKGYVRSELTNEGTLNNEGIVSSLLFIMRYITPILIIIVFLKTFI